MNDSNDHSDREAEPPRSPDLAAFNPFAPLFRNAAAVIGQTWDAVSGFTNLLNNLTNPTSTVRAISAKGDGPAGDVTGIEMRALPGGTAAGQPGTDASRAGGTHSDTPTEPGGHPPTADGSFGGLLGTVGRVAARPVGMFAETLRQVQQVQSGAASAQAGARDDSAHLKKRGAALVRISCKPEYQRRDVHPSFSHILDELLPDEARILRFLAVAGTQPAIDVRTKSLFQVGSVKLVGGVNMIAEMSGCKWPDRGYHYLANLNRLGLIDFSKEPVDDYRRYALLEVQPAATAAIARAPRSISVYRSIALTSFGRQFVGVCIDTDGYDGGGWATDGREDKILGKGPPA